MRSESRLPFKATTIHVSISGLEPRPRYQAKSGLACKPTWLNSSSSLAAPHSYMRARSSVCPIRTLSSQSRLLLNRRWLVPNGYHCTLDREQASVLLRDRPRANGARSDAGKPLRGSLISSDCRAYSPAMAVHFCWLLADKRLPACRRRRVTTSSEKRANSRLLTLLPPGPASTSTLDLGRRGM